MNINNGDMPAMPTRATLDRMNDKFEEAQTDSDDFLLFGLTKREEFAKAMMQGLLAAWGQHDVTDFGEIASDAVMAADALLKELAK